MLSPTLGLNRSLEGRNARDQGLSRRFEGGFWGCFRLHVLLQPGVLGANVQVGLDSVRGVCVGGAMWETVF